MDIRLLTIGENGEIVDLISCLPKINFDDVAKYIIAKEFKKSKMYKKDNKIKNKKQTI